MILKIYKCDLCDEEVKPEPTSTGHRLKWNGPGKIRLCSLSDPVGSDTILCLDCQKGLKAALNGAALT